MRFLRLSCATALAALLVALNLMVAVSFPLELQEQCPRSHPMTSRAGASGNFTKISIVVPTYKERDNIPILTKRIFQELKPHNIVPEVIFVDDNSQDGSVEEVKKLQDAKYDVRIIVRTTERGLSSAVLRGFKEASHEVLVCMDADLQHDPKYLPALVGPIIANTADFTVGSRHVGGGGIEGWSLHRKLLSWGATLAASPLVKCSDPMSGFFSLRKSTLNRAEVLNPLGYKIGLELMVRCKCTRIKEIPIVFKDRELGESKLTMKTNILYLIHLLNLYAAAKPQYLLVLLLIVLAIIVIIFRRFVK